MIKKKLTCRQEGKNQSGVQRREGKNPLACIGKREKTNRWRAEARRKKLTCKDEGKKHHVKRRMEKKARTYRNEQPKIYMYRGEV